MSPKKMNQFDQDILANRGYLYTTNAPESSRIANNRQTEITKTMVGDLEGKKIIDVGCGDGTYTYELYQWGKPKIKIMMGIDNAHEAIRLAKKRFGKKDKGLVFQHNSCYDLPYPSASFDLALLRGVLHHLDQPFLGLEEVVRVAKTIFVIEPNGYNLFLKLVERISPYHRQHHERSFTPFIIRSWVKKLNQSILKTNYVGLVPFFCPVWLARILKVLEPLIERTPVFKNLFCSVYVVLFSKQQ